MQSENISVYAQSFFQKIKKMCNLWCHQVKKQDLLFNQKLFFEKIYLAKMVLNDSMQASKSFRWDCYWLCPLSGNPEVPNLGQTLAVCVCVCLGDDLKPHSQTAISLTNAGMFELAIWVERRVDARLPRDGSLTGISRWGKSGNRIRVLVVHEAPCAAVGYQCSRGRKC